MEIKIRRILCPVDFSAYCEHALRYALAFAKAHDAELKLLHVLELPFLPSYSMAGVPDLSLPVEEMERDADKRMEELIERCRETHGRVTGRVTIGTPFLEIINHARDSETDLIVAGTHGRTGLKQLLIGSVAEKIVRKAPCPVLTVKDPEHEFVMP